LELRRSTEVRLNEALADQDQAYAEQIGSLKTTNDTLIAQAVTSKEQLENVKTYYEERIAELVRTHNAEAERLHENHKQELEAASSGFSSLAATCHGLKKGVNDSPREILVKDVESMGTVIELNQKRIKELQTKVAVLTLKEEELIACESQVRTLSARVEDLEAQLNASREDNKALINKTDVAEMNLLDALGKNKTLSQAVDELTWKLNNPGVVPVSPSAVNFKEQQKNGASRPLATTSPPPHQPPSRNCTKSN